MYSKEPNWLITHYLLGRLSEEDQKQLQEWIDLSPKNKAFFEKTCTSDKAQSDYWKYKQIDKEHAYRNFLAKTGNKKGELFFAPWMKYAAVAVLLITLSLPFVFHFRSGSSIHATAIAPGQPRAILITDDGSELPLCNDSVTQIKSGKILLATNTTNGIEYNRITGKNAVEKYNTLVVPRGGEYRITLSDGTKIHLNSASELKYPVAFTGKIRDVYLKGEAYFEIAKDSVRPFIVNSGDIKIKQYGTAFNVNARSPEKIEVVLVHGSISLLTHNDENEYRIKPSQLAEYNNSVQSVDVQTVDIKPYVAWNEGKFIFENKALGEIMETLSLWYNMDVEFKDDELKTLRFTGSVTRDTPVEYILNAIEYATDVHISVKEKMVYIKK